jgi:hypothetical protein
MTTYFETTNQYNLPTSRLGIRKGGQTHFGDLNAKTAAINVLSKFGLESL